MNSPSEDPAPLRPSYAAYRALLEAQRAAIRQGNTRVLTGLTSRAGQMLNTIELPGQPPDPAAVDAALAEALVTQNTLRDLGARVRQERERLKIELSHARAGELDRPESKLDRRG